MLSLWFSFSGIVSSAAGARLSVAESLTNIVFTPITALEDVKCSGNWMWPAKLPGEGKRLVEACDAMCDIMKEIGIAVDGGKDSLSMAAKVEGTVVKSPGTLVISSYAPVTDITKVVGPNLKPSESSAISDANILLYIPMYSESYRSRIGGSALAQCLKQVGTIVPDIDDAKYFKKTFKAIQKVVNDGLILAGHDVSDGGLLTTLIEMAFGGNNGISLDFNLPKDTSTSESNEIIAALFSEESGVVIEVNSTQLAIVEAIFGQDNIKTYQIGRSLPIYGSAATVSVFFNGKNVYDEKLHVLLELFEEVSDKMELLQTNKKAVKEQQQWRKDIKNPKFTATFDYGVVKAVENKPKVAVLREEGSNGDREMAAAFILAGFDAVDLTMTDLLDAKVSLDQFKGIAFVGGFSYADVLGSAKGWAASIQYHPELAAEFERFRQRKDTFSFGVCNGCQLMGLLGWIGETEEVGKTKGKLEEPVKLHKFLFYVEF